MRLAQNQFNFCMTELRRSYSVQIVFNVHNPVTRGPWGLYRSPVFTSNIV